MNKAKFIETVVREEYPDCSKKILSLPIIKYLHKKTRSVTKGSKSRGSFANLYAIYVLVEDYINKGFESLEDYDGYDGMQYTDALKRQRELPFGEKLQNHALNHRCNEEFVKYNPQLANEVPIVRDKQTSRYWFNEYHLISECNGSEINIARLIIRIIDRYVELKRADFENFFQSLESLSSNGELTKLETLIMQQLNPKVDARIFEVVSYCILRQVYEDKFVFWGNREDDITPEKLKLYRTGRTNSNDGGIDFIMKPIGRIFQVTEVLDFKKYFLDIEKINKYPITFVIKTELSPEEAMLEIQDQAEELYQDPLVKKSYLDAFEEIITIPTLAANLASIITKSKMPQLSSDIIKHCKVEFNIRD